MGRDMDYLAHLDDDDDDDDDKDLLKKRHSQSERDLRWLLRNL